jgi:hypothetical protein
MGNLELWMTHFNLHLYDEPVVVWRYALTVWLVYTGTVIQVFSFITSAPLLLVTIAQGLLFVAELVVRRLAEAPKGVVMAVSGIVTAIGAVLKALA